MLKYRIFSFLLPLITGGMWYLFTSGEAFTKTTAHRKAKRKELRDTAARKPYILLDTVAYSPLERYEAVTSDSLFNEMAVCEKFNGTALFAHNGKILFSQNFGYTDFDTKAPITDSSEFQLGSVSKQFTAVAVMMLKEQGKLDYDDFVTAYFPDFPYKGVTIEMLLDHRSGLPNYLYTCSTELTDQSVMIDNMELMDMLANYKPECYFKPNKKFNYCNTNYCVLAAIVEKVSGVSFAGFLRENIFNPLGMKHTHIFDKYDTVIPDRVVGYEHNFKKSGSDFSDGIVGDKGIYSTVSDLLKWDQALYGEKLLKQATLKEAWQPRTRWMGGKSYGYGWHLLLYDKDTIPYHGGWWHGFNANFIRDVKQGNTIIILSNRVNWCINRSYELLGLCRKSPLNNTDSTDPAPEEGLGTN